MALKKLSTLRPTTSRITQPVSRPVTRLPIVQQNPYARLIGPTATQAHQGEPTPESKDTQEDTSTAGDPTVEQQMQTEELEFGWKKFMEEKGFNQEKLNSDAKNAIFEMENQLKEITNKYELGKVELSNADAANLRDYEAKIAQMKNDLELGKGSLQTQLELQKMNNTLSERLGMAGYKADLIKSKMNADVTRELEGLATMSDFQLGKGELGLNQQLGQSQTAADLAANLGSLGAQERMGSSANAANMAMQGRGIASNERLGMAGLGAQMAQNQMQLQADRESGLLGGALESSNQRAMGERGRQTDLTGQALQAYQALAAAQSGPPGGWLNSWFANRGQVAPEGADTGLAQNLGQYAAQLGATGLGVDPNTFTDQMIANIYNKGNRAEVGSMDDLIDASTAGAYEGLPQERAEYDARTGRMMRNAEYNRGKDAAFQKSLATSIYGSGEPGGRVVGEATTPGMPTGYPNFMNNADYYKSADAAANWDPGEYGYDMPNLQDPSAPPGQRNIPPQYQEMNMQQFQDQQRRVNQFPTAPPGTNPNVRRAPGYPPARRRPGRVYNNAGMAPRGGVGVMGFGADQGPTVDRSRMKPQPWESNEAVGIVGQPRMGRPDQGPINQGFMQGRPDRGPTYQGNAEILPGGMGQAPQLNMQEQLQQLPAEIVGGAAAVPGQPRMGLGESTTWGQDPNKAETDRRILGDQFGSATTGQEYTQPQGPTPWNQNMQAKEYRGPQRQGGRRVGNSIFYDNFDQGQGDARGTTEQFSTPPWMQQNRTPPRRPQPMQQQRGRPQPRPMPRQQQRGRPQQQYQPRQRGVYQGI